MFHEADAMGVCQEGEGYLLQLIHGLPAPQTAPFYPDADRLCPEVIVPDLVQQFTEQILYVTYLYHCFTPCDSVVGPSLRDHHNRVLLRTWASCPSLASSLHGLGRSTPQLCQ